MYRAAGIVLVVVGVVVAAGLVVFGVDAYASARRGPRWWRRLLAAGLVVLAALGVGECSRRQQTACYAPAPLSLAQMSLSRLGEQLPALEALLGSDTISRAVARTTLETIEREIGVLTSDDALAALGASDRAKAVELRERALERVRELRRRLELPAQGLQTTAEWTVALDAWRSVAPIAERPTTTAERAGARAKLDGARAALGRLQERSLLSEAERSLLADDLARIEAALLRSPPTDNQVMCYDMAMLVPARASLERLARRAPLLEAIALAGGASDAVIEQVRLSIELDVAELSKPEALAAAGIDAATAAGMCERIARALAAVRRAAE